MPFRFPSQGFYDPPGGNRRTFEYFAQIPNWRNVSIFLDPGCDFLAKMVVFGKGESAHRSIVFLGYSR